MLYDIHTHAFHEKIADKVTDQLHHHYKIAPFGNGRLDELLALEKQAGIDIAVVHSAATSAAQVIPANNWAMQLQKEHDNVIAFGTMHVDYDNAEQEFDRLAAHGIKGLKFHPDFQGFWLNDPKFYALMEMMHDRFVLMIHVGDMAPPEENPSCPFKLLALHEAFPNTKIIAAHFGGYQHWKYVPQTLCGKNIWIDTSSSLQAITDEELHAIWSKHPRERILFGSDYPLFKPLDVMYQLQKRLHLSDSDLEYHASLAGELFEH